MHGVYSCHLNKDQYLHELTTSSHLLRWFGCHDLNKLYCLATKELIHFNTIFTFDFSLEGRLSVLRTTDLAQSEEKSTIVMNNILFLWPLDAVSYNLLLQFFLIETSLKQYFPTFFNTFTDEPNATYLQKICIAFTTFEKIKILKSLRIFMEHLGSANHLLRNTG